VANIAESIVETIGNTPLVKLNTVTAGLEATVLLKCEFFNPLGSVKDRIGKAMIEDAEKRGIIDKDTVIIEPTSGNTGIALAFIAAAKGYKLILTMPDTMSIERRTLLAILGAELVLTPGATGMRGAIDKAHSLAKEIKNSWIPQQFDNPSNPEIHRRTTAEEIWNDTDGNVDAVVAAVGTGGTLTGCMEVIKPRKPGFSAIAVEPQDSPVINQTLTGAPICPGMNRIQGIGAGFVPSNFHLYDDAGNPQISECVQVTSDNAFEMARRLAKEEGILAGISSGANVWAAIQVAARPEFKGKTIVTFACSTGERYLSTALAATARAAVS
jgi:cysteine synthase A